MQAEFVNVFVEKQREHLMDFISRLMMAETKLHFAEKNYMDAETELQQLKIEHEKLLQDFNATGEKIEQYMMSEQALISDRDRDAEEIKKLKKTVEDLNINLAQDNEANAKKIDDLTVVLSEARSKIEDLEETIKMQEEMIAEADQTIQSFKNISQNKK